ncbi:MAG: 50S ribosomal protein L21 [Paracoccaceae bacterium]|nr:50S ribosomal protein L21 [Paracoccaceae bacterium]
MFAVIKTGGKQYRVAVGDVVKVEKLPGEAGDIVEFDEVLLLSGDGVTVGTPTVPGAVVRGDILEQTRDKKVINFVHRRRKASSRRKKGHRQSVSIVEIAEIRPPAAEGGGSNG